MYSTHKKLRIKLFKTSQALTDGVGVEVTINVSEYLVRYQTGAWACGSRCSTRDGGRSLHRVDVSRHQDQGYVDRRTRAVPRDAE